jgi:hypothetical protein
MAHLLEANLPIRFQCLAVATKWVLIKQLPDGSLLHPKEGRNNGLHVMSVVESPPTTFDPWDKRDEFFRLSEGNTEGLLSLLRTVGLFQAASQAQGASPEQKDFVEEISIKAGKGLGFEVRYVTEFEEATIWQLRRVLLNTLKGYGDVGDYSEFRVRIVRVRGEPQIVLTTTTFMEALLLTIVADRVMGAKLQKCARPDCGTVFSTTGGHKRKYCQWYCGHIESVRNSRRSNRGK